jgi:hypothetical protein
VPIKPRSKQPLVPWQDYQQQPPAAAELARWFQRWPDAGIAIVTGQVSNLVVLDIDPGHGGEVSVKALEAKFGPLPATLTVRTGGGGRHFYFTAPADSRPIPNRVGLSKGIDVRGDGGLVVAPPSVHPSGRRYRWVEGGPYARATPAPPPIWLIGLIRHAGPRHGHSLAYWRELVARGVEQGERNSTIASFAGHLFWHGVDPQIVEELLLCWNRVRAHPPLDDEEVARTVESIRRTHARQEADELPAADRRTRRNAGKD